MDAEYEKNFRRELADAGEASVRADFFSGGGLSTGGEDRRKIIRQWLREREQERESREKESFRLGQKTFWIALLTLIAAVVGVAVTYLHK
jgi:hypothetical protein